MKVDVPGKCTVLPCGSCSSWPAGYTDARNTQSCEPEGNTLLGRFLSSLWGRRIHQLADYSPKSKEARLADGFLLGILHLSVSSES